MSYQELKTHGKSDFPFELYRLEKGFPKYEMVHHYHPFIEIILIDKGVLSVTLNTRKYLAKKGDVIIVNSGVIHGAKPEKPRLKAREKNQCKITPLTCQPCRDVYQYAHTISVCCPLRQH